MRPLRPRRRGGTAGLVAGADHADPQLPAAYPGGPSAARERRRHRVADLHGDIGVGDGRAARVADRQRPGLPVLHLFLCGRLQAGDVGAADEREERRHPPALRPGRGRARGHAGTRGSRWGRGANHKRPEEMSLLEGRYDSQLRDGEHDDGCGDVSWAGEEAAGRPADPEQARAAAKDVERRPHAHDDEAPQLVDAAHLDVEQE
mmetsp:Transcript_43074/g.111251  ORF Transcript_43074/g.111251 Transcript_43074/m.111251 type:complete len:204 (-) Transcript_43074:412-1023(-)